MFLRSCKSSTVHNAEYICALTAFSDVPKKDLMCRFCFICLKKSSTCHLCLYMAPMVDAAKWRIFVSITISFFFSAIQIVTDRNVCGHRLPFADVNQICTSRRTAPSSVELDFDCNSTSSNTALSFRRVTKKIPLVVMVLNKP